MGDGEQGRGGRQEERLRTGQEAEPVVLAKGRAEGGGEPPEEVGGHEEEVGRHEAGKLQPDAEILVPVYGVEEEVKESPKNPIAADVEEAYRESDLPASRARDRAERAQDNADRSGQGEEGPGEDEKGVGALEESDGG